MCPLCIAEYTYHLLSIQLQATITSLENKNLAEKPWQLVGEVAATARPLNSLLAEDLDYEQQTRQGECSASVSFEKFLQYIRQYLCSYNDLLECFACSEVLQH